MKRIDLPQDKQLREVALRSIVKRANEYDEGALHFERQIRLKSLVENHGVDAVMAATGFTHRTLQEYLSRSRNLKINENSVRKAEDILGT